MFNKQELEALLGLVEFCWKGGGVRDPNAGVLLDGIAKKAMGILKALEAKNKPKEEDEK